MRDNWAGTVEDGHPWTPCVYSMSHMGRVGFPFRDLRGQRPQKIKHQIPYLFFLSLGQEGTCGG